MASIRKRGSTYEARLLHRGRALSKSFSSVEEAKRWVTGIKLGFLQPGGPRESVLTLGDALQKYCVEVVLKQRGAFQAQKRIEAIQGLAMAAKRLIEVCPNDIRQYRDTELARGLADSTVLRGLSILSAFFNHAIREWGLDIDNPVARIRKPKPSRARSVRIEASDLERLYTAAERSRNKLLKPAIAFVLETGLRRSELLRLLWVDIDMQRRILTVRDSKSGRERFVPLTGQALDILTKLDDSLDRPFVMSTTALNQAWLRCRKRAGMFTLRFHDLRHEALSRWAARVGGDIFKLAAISGHLTLQMTNRYVHPFQSELIACL